METVAQYPFVFRARPSFDDRPHISSYRI